MTESNASAPPEPDAPGDGEIDLSQLAHVLWHYRLSIVLLVVIGAAVGAAASDASKRYRSQGLFLTPGLTVDNYKPFEAAVANEARMRSFLALAGDPKSPAARFLVEMMQKPRGIQEAIRPAFAFTDRDARQFGVRADESAIVGVTIALEEAALPEREAPFALLGEYVRDTRIKLDMERIMDAACLEQLRREAELRNAQLKDEFQLSQHQIMAATLRELVERFPQATQADSRQVVSLEKGAERFLSPVAQLVALEIAMEELNLAENKRERERIANQVMKDYYCSGRDVLKGEAILGRGFMHHLETIHERVVGAREAGNSAVEEASNELKMQRASWTEDYLNGMRFVTQPEGSHSLVRKLGLASGVALGLLGGLVLGVMLAFLRHWWRYNRDAVLADDRR